MALDPKLLEILACPEDKGPLLYFEDESSLYNPRLHRRYEVRDDIPIMLIDEAVVVDDAEHDRERPHADRDRAEQGGDEREARRRLLQQPAVGAHRGPSRDPPTRKILLPQEVARRPGDESTPPRPRSR